jgi:hypothetical protein
MLSPTMPINYRIERPSAALPVARPRCRQRLAGLRSLSSLLPARRRYIDVEFNRFPASMAAKKITRCARCGTDGGNIPVGRIVFETLSAGLDPYPRKPTRNFVVRQGRARHENIVLSALSKLKSKP